MKAFILALATALPQYSTDQNNIAKRIIEICQLRGRSAESIENLFTKTGIHTRYSVLKDFTPFDSLNNPDHPEQAQARRTGQDEREEGPTLFNNNMLEKAPCTQVRNDIYIQEAPKLALAAAKNAIAMWSRPATEITHIISVSCTGIMAPGIEFILQNELGLHDDVQRLGINFMGCFGAFKGLAIANSLAKENSNNRILVVCTELCSLHFQLSIRPEILIGNALFADGAAAVIVGSEIREYEHSLWSIEKFSSHALKNSQDKMTWTASNHGLVMSLARDVPKIIETEAPHHIRNFLQNYEYENLTWAIHPGGKAIVEAIERTCNLSNSQTASSWQVLKDYGNMSSATFLFVLNDIIKNKNLPAVPTVAKDGALASRGVVGIGFGPGLSLEMILLGK